MSASIESRLHGVADCLEWFTTLGDRDTSAQWVADLRATVQFQPDRLVESDHADGLGVYLKRAVAKGETIFNIPIKAGLTVTHSQFTSASAVQDVLQQAQTALQELIREQAAQVSPHDRYAKVQGRVIPINYWILTFAVTLLLVCQADEESSSSSPVLPTNSDMTTQLTTMYQYWKPYLDTIPADWSHLSFLWPDEELEPLAGTSFYALTRRLQAEITQVFDQVFGPSLWSVGRLHGGRSIARGGMEQGGNL